VQSRPDIDWDYMSLSGNPNITWEIVKEYPQYTWSSYIFASNPMYYWQNKQSEVVLK
jgi:hypothetical protein